ncbi:hypothetical protein K239x_04060 [Planctomycetes bacterium K23_9]|uniref:Uncharacterized protein n=1 Tax=Stieleria marina TaxID=1930275 RepID=A0A517NMW5_9BACT|nr:hypothetical protein K239x_04060 [Planctomycetes bacterium K23_9]
MDRGTSFEVSRFFCEPLTQDTGLLQYPVSGTRLTSNSAERLGFPYTKAVLHHRSMPVASARGSQDSASHAFNLCLTPHRNVFPEHFR